MTISFSRIGTANTYDSSIRNISARGTALSNLQENLTSGKRVVRASDDPTAAANAERAMTRISRIAADQRALEAQRNSIAQAESTLGEATDVLQRFRELLVSAGNGINSAAERKSIAIELQGLRDQVFALSNTKDTNGLPLFSALGSALSPFVGPQATAPDYTFNGLPGQTASSDVAIPFTLDGDGAFMLQSARDGVYNVQISTMPPSHSLSTSGVTLSNPTLLTGDSYTIDIVSVDTTTIGGSSIVTYDVTSSSGATVNWVAPSYPSNTTAKIDVQGMAGLSMTLSGTPAAGDRISVAASPSLFSVLDNAIKDIGGASDSNSATQAVSQALHNIDIGMARISAVRGQAGDLLNRADRISSNQENRSIQLEADRSRAEDLDMVQGISDFNNQQTGYSAALQTYAKVQQLSLFNYIS
ncbi:flagellar hook-associated protein FlgL [Rhodoferax sp. 4810]|nr:flagellar hook-associated protein FlgL [Rhodoferax jenense]